MTVKQINHTLGIRSLSTGNTPYTSRNVEQSRAELSAPQPTLASKMLRNLPLTLQGWIVLLERISVSSRCTIERWKL